MQSALSLPLTKSLQHNKHHATPNHTLRRHRLVASRSNPLHLRTISCSHTTQKNPPKEPGQRRKVAPAVAVVGATSVVLACTFGSMYLKNCALALAPTQSTPSVSSTTLEVKPGTMPEPEGRDPSKLHELRTPKETKPIDGQTTKQTAKTTVPIWTVPIAGETTEQKPVLAKTVTTDTMKVLSEILLKRQTSSQLLPTLLSDAVLDVVFDFEFEQQFYKMLVAEKMKNMVMNMDTSKDEGEERKEQILKILHQKYIDGGNYDLGLSLIQIYISRKEYLKAKDICKRMIKYEKYQPSQNDSRPHLYMAIIQMMLAVEMMLEPNKTTIENLHKTKENALTSWSKFTEIYKNYGAPPAV